MGTLRRKSDQIRRAFDADSFDVANRRRRSRGSDASVGSHEIVSPLSSELGARKTVKARFWPWNLALGFRDLLKSP